MREPSVPPVFKNAEIMRVSLFRFPVANPLAVWGMVCFLALLGTAVQTARGAPTEREIQRAIQRGVAALKGDVSSLRQGRDSVVALALLKADVPPESPEVAAVIEKIREKIDNETGKYRPQTDSTHIYEAGVDLMALEAADAELYFNEIEVIANHVIEYQFPAGYWDYGFWSSQQGAAVQRRSYEGDTSITQYAMLGLWAAARAGVHVPDDVWDRAAHWHIAKQLQNGGFVYHPGERNDARHSMTVAGVGSLYISRLYLFPGRNQAVVASRSPASSRRGSRGRKFGILERFDENEPPEKTKASTRPRTPSSYTKKVTSANLDAAIGKGLDWMVEHFTVANPTGHPIYYLYGLERMAALADIESVGTHDWYAEGAAHLLRTQDGKGMWSCTSGNQTGTAFALLFLTKATARTLGKSSSPRFVGEGLLIGGRGLPEDLQQVEVADGQVKARKTSGTVDELLAELENPRSDRIESVQNALVESVQVGDRETLIGQKDRLKVLVNDPRVEVKRTALWALGRSEDLQLAPLLIEALNDADVSVMIEAHNALCTLSRKPLGLGLPGRPDEGLGEDASDEEIKRAVEKWQAEAIEKWKGWYFQVRSYDERDDFFDFQRQHRSSR